MTKRKKERIRQRKYGEKSGRREKEKNKYWEIRIESERSSWRIRERDKLKSEGRAQRKRERKWFS